MALAFPRELPLSGSIFAPGSNLEPGWAVSENVDRSGMREVMEEGDPLWKLTLVTKPLRVSQRAIWKAWAMSLHGGVQLFWAYPPIQQYPLAYGAGALGLLRAGGGAFDGTATIGVPANASSVPLSNLPALYMIRAGDMLSVSLTTGSRMLHIVTEAVTASGGGAATVQVAPFVRDDTAESVATVQLVRPKALFVLRSMDTQDAEVSAPVTLRADQTVRAI